MAVDGDFSHQSPARYAQFQAGLFILFAISKEVCDKIKKAEPPDEAKQRTVPRLTT